MNLVISATLLVTFASAALADADPSSGPALDQLNAEEARQKIYEIISGHEDRKYGDHGGHEYEDGEVPKKSSSLKDKVYGYLPSEGGKYYYAEQPHKEDLVYEPKSVYANKPYSVHHPPEKAYYPAPKERYPVVENLYALPKRGFITRENAEAVRKRYRPLYSVRDRPKLDDYQDVKYIEDKSAPITIGQTARTVYASPVNHPQYAVVDPKAPAEYLTFDGKQPKPLILDPKLKETYHQYHQPPHYSTPEHQVIKSEVPVPVYKTAYIPPQPEGHYSAPQKQVVLNPEVVVPVHYSPPVKGYVKYDDHHNVDDLGHRASGHGHYGDNLVRKESGHKTHGSHDVSGHKAHSAVGAKHDEHSRHHNRGLYERDRGYHYEKAYAYDRVRAHHDIGADKGSHSSYGAHHGHEAHKDAGHHGAETNSYFKKDDRDSGYGYHNGNSLYKRGQNHGHKYVPVYYAS